MPYLNYNVTVLKINVCFVRLPCNIHVPYVSRGVWSTSFPGFSPTHPTERERERPWKTLVTCLPESGRLQTNDLGKGQVSVRFVPTDRRQVSVAVPDPFLNAEINAQNPLTAKA